MCMESSFQGPIVTEAELRADARAIWDAAVEAAKPGPLIRSAMTSALAAELGTARRILVVGGGKAGSAMAVALEAAIASQLAKIEGIVNVPAGSEMPTQRIRLHPARPAGSNHPTHEGVAGSELMLNLMSSATPEDIAICLLSGGGSALLPAPAPGVSLEDKQAITRLLHACGATIVEMNAVRKHLSRIKGGKLAAAFRGRRLISMIISDVVGDPLDVIASGPTSPDPTTFADALAVLDRYKLLDRTPASIRKHLEAGRDRRVDETPKSLPAHVENRIIGNNSMSLQAAKSEALRRGYRVLNLGAFVEGETQQVALAVAGIVRSIRSDGEPLAPTACVLIGGETTVTLGANPGKGGRNQEFVLAMLAKLGAAGMQGVAVLSGGTDGEDGPTDAAGAMATQSTLQHAKANNLRIGEYLHRHDAYSFFDSTGDLIRTGLTHTNVMDVRVVLVS